MDKNIRETFNQKKTAASTWYWQPIHGEVGSGCTLAFCYNGYMWLLSCCWNIKGPTMTISLNSIILTAKLKFYIVQISNNFVINDI